MIFQGVYLTIIYTFYMFGIVFADSDHRSSYKISGRVAKRASAHTFDNRVFDKSEVEQSASDTACYINALHSGKLTRLDVTQCYGIQVVLPSVSV